MRLISIEGDFEHYEHATFSLSREEKENLMLDFSADYEIFPKLNLPKLGKQKKDVMVIFNNPATILFVAGDKFVVKCHEEKFDEEKAVAIALLKSFGISYPDLKRIIKNAKRPENKKENK